MPRRKTRDGNVPAKLRVLSDLDMQTAAAKTASALPDRIIADLGGTENLSELERIAAEHAAVAAVVTQDAYSKWLAGQEIPLTDISVVQNCFLRIATALGWQRRARDVTRVDIADYLDQQ